MQIPARSITIVFVIRTYNKGYDWVFLPHRYRSRSHPTKNIYLKFEKTFCDWLIYETAHAHTLFLTH